MVLAQVIELNEESSEEWVGANYVQVFEDTSRQFSIESYSCEDALKHFNKSSNNAGLLTRNHNSAYWLTFQVKNATDTDGQWILEFFDHEIDHITFYSPDEDKEWQKKEVGSTLPFHRKELNHKNFEFILKLKSQETRRYFIRVTSSKNNWIVPVIRSFPKLLNYALGEYYLLGIFYGMMVLILIYNLLFLIGIGSRSYVFHILYILSIILYSMSNDGMGFQYFWPSQPWINKYIHTVALFAVELSALLFTISFLKLKTESPKIHLILRVAIGLLIIRFVIAIVFWGFPVQENVFDLAPLLIAFVSGLYFYIRKRYIPARFFVYAYVFLFIGFSISVLERADIIPSSAFTFYSLNFATVLEIIFFSFALVHQVRKTIQEKEELIDRHNRELEQKVKDRTKELNEQKLIVESKNQKITSSINYAKNIQSAILPSVSSIKKVYPDSFIYYKPRDIVSGDFYYFAQHQGKDILGVIDCTGHGVPGGFMSMIGYALLNESIFTNGTTSPGAILDELHKGIVAGLRQENDDINIKDGMDLSLFTIEGNKLEFAGANNPLIIVRNNELISLAADRQPIGDASTRHKDFKTTSFDLEKGDCIYAFTDGFHDQFGGPEGKKFMKKLFKDLLLDIHHQPMDKQQGILATTFNTWKKDEEQIDDVTVMGIRF